MHAEHLVNLGGGERTIGSCYSTENFRVQLDLLECNAVVEAQVGIITQRDHLRPRKPHSQELAVQASGSAGGCA
jgi:hypothetical protein